MVGARFCAIVRRPNFAWSANHASTVPGTVTGNGPCGGMFFSPRRSNSSSVSAFGERPEPL